MNCVDAGPRDAPWDTLIAVYENAIDELLTLNDPTLDPFLARLTELHDRAVANVDLAGSAPALRPRSTSAPR